MGSLSANRRRTWFGPEPNVRCGSSRGVMRYWARRSWTYRTLSDSVPSQRMSRFVEDDVEQHQSLDHPAAMGSLPIAVVRFADQAVEALVVEVIEPPLIQMTRGLHAGEAALDQPVYEVVRLLSVGDAGETAVLRLEEHAGVCMTVVRNRDWRSMWSIRSWIPKVADQMPVREQHGYKQACQRKQPDQE